MKVMPASELTAHTLTEAEWLARDNRHDYSGRVDMTLTVSTARLHRAIPLAWALFPKLRVDVDDALGYKWTVHCVARNADGDIVHENTVLNDGC